MTPMVIKNPLVMQYEGLDFRERIGEEWPQLDGATSVG